MKIIALGEILQRLSTPLNEQITNSQYLNTYYGGGEYNTLVNLAGLGHEAEMISAFPDNELSERIKIEARKYNVKMNHSIIKEGRLGIYYTLLGNDVSSTKVIYDRSSSSFALSKYDDYDFSKCFEGADVLHVSGITAALSYDTREMTIKAIKKAKENNLKISFDSNYRAKLWTSEQAGNFLMEVLPLVDYAFLGILDVKYLLNINVNTVEEAYEYLKNKYPNIEYIASTNRNVISTAKHELSVNIYHENLYVSKKTTINVKDRVGAGDVFTAGVLDGIYHNKNKKEIAEFALANAVYKHYQLGDNCFVTREKIEDIMIGSSLKIKR